MIQYYLLRDLHGFCALLSVFKRNPNPTMVPVRPTLDSCWRVVVARHAVLYSREYCCKSTEAMELAGLVLEEEFPWYENASNQYCH